MQKFAKSSEFCMILQEILQKYAHDVSIIGHNVNGIPSEMQETRQSLQGTPPFYKSCCALFSGKANSTPPRPHVPQFVPKSVSQLGSKHHLLITIGDLNRPRLSQSRFVLCCVDFHICFHNVGSGRRFLLARMQRGGRGYFQNWGEKIGIG